LGLNSFTKKLEGKKVRTKEDIQQEYLKVCSQAGEMQYKIGQFKKELTRVHDELNKLNQKIDNLNKEYTAILSEVTITPKEEPANEIVAPVEAPAAPQA
jgi:archaellum component FlaC